MTYKTLCETCNVRVPKHRPLLTCSLCQQPKHYKCNNLSRREAEEIVKNPAENRAWACQNCYLELFPGIVSDNVNCTPKIRKTTTEPVDNTICTVCKKTCSNKPLNNATNTITCVWCNLPCHRKCYKDQLGCLNCCSEMIPGYFYESYHLNCDNLKRKIKLFNPYDIDSIFNRIGSEDENGFLDPHLTEISDLLNRCSYKEPSNVTNVRSDELRVLYLNVRSLSGHIDECRENFSYSKNYDVLCFNETSCDPNSLSEGIQSIRIDGFHEPIVQKPHRDTNKGGGLAVYINSNVCEADNFEMYVIPDSELDPNMTPPMIPCEKLFVKINIKQVHHNNFKSYLVGNFYRSPSLSTSSLHDYLDNVLTALDRHGNKNITIGGDFNVDLCNYEHNQDSQALIDTFAKHNFVQLINRPTRVTEHSATLIDHIYTNKVSDVVTTGVVTLDISDHLGPYVTIALHDHPGSLDHEYAKYVKSHKINEENLAKFKEYLESETWDDVRNAPGTQEKYNHFIDTYTKHYNAAFPEKASRRKNERKVPKPWILPWLEDACARKNKLYADFVNEPSEGNKKSYDKMNKFVRKHVDLAKQKYYTNLFNKYSDCSKKQWQIINSLMNRSNAKKSQIKLKDSYGNIEKNPQNVAEKFNEYFTTIADNLKAQIPTDPDSTYDYTTTLTDGVPDTLFLNPTHPLEIESTIKSLKLRSTSDINISTLKIAAEASNFKEILSEIINTSFIDGIFPEQLKIAKVIPIFKGGSKAEVSNYRPISLLSAFSKIFEKLMHSRVYKLLEKNQSLYDKQFGFRPGRSCEHALLVAQNDILTALNKKQSALLLLIDYSKAFDMVSHEILLYKLRHYGIRGKAHDWFRSYLSNRSQFVAIDGERSSTKSITTGVPQGSVLGPLLFILFINDLPNINSKVQFILYADDANIIITAETEAEIISILEELCRDLVQWVNINGLFLNLKKTNYMVFTRKRSSVLENFDPYVGQVKIERKTVARFLGVLIDEKLTWSYHIAAVKAKMSRYIGTLYKLKKKLPLKARLLTFNSLVQSHLNYCSLIWGTTNKCKIEQLFATQKKAIRAIMPGHVDYLFKDGNPPTHTKPFFNEHELLTVHSIVLKNILIFMNKVHNFPQLLPKSVLQTIAIDSPNPSNREQELYLSAWYTTYNTPAYRTTTYFKGPILFRSLCLDPENDWIAYHNLNRYKSNIKNYLVKDVQSKCANDDTCTLWTTENFPLNTITGLRYSARLKVKPPVPYAEANVTN